MNDNSKNKVCFECAGKPVILRIIENMRAAGLSRFVLVVGHQAQGVMDSLAGVEGIAYAYQKEQKGTGHAVKCGLDALSAMGFEGQVLVSMGDKIVGTEVIKEMIARAGRREALWGVQPLSVNPGGGRVIVADGMPYGVVELADLAYQSLSGVPAVEWGGSLRRLGLNEKKAKKVMERAEVLPPAGEVILNGRRFTAAELSAASAYANAGLYCFDIKAILAALASCGSDNAQGEIYLTDALELFAGRDQAELLTVEKPEDMLTFSTKPELRKISRNFIKTVSAFVEDIERGHGNETLHELYGEQAEEQTMRYVGLLKTFMAKYGDRQVVITRAPGRINLMGRHIDHRGGCTNMMVIDKDTVMVASPREDDIVHVSNLDANYPEAEFSISECLGLAADAKDWLSYLDAPKVREALNKGRGHWVNYIKSAVLRFQHAMDLPLCGMDLMVTGRVATGAGLSSSSSLVVATGEALVALNCLNLSPEQFVDLCGEGEWLVGSRGGAGDHAAMKFARRDQIVTMNFKPFSIGRSHSFSDRYAIVVADSLQQAKKSEYSRDTFNERVAAYEFGFMMLRRNFPQRGWREFRELADIQPQSDIYRMLATLPERVTRKQVIEMLPTQHERIQQIFDSHSEPKDGYELRGVMLYGISECLRARRFGDLLDAGDYQAIGDMMKISQDGDRLVSRDFSNETLFALADRNADVALECGSYACSTERIDQLCDLLDSLPGVKGSSLVGAGLGGSVIALVEKEKVSDVLAALEERFYVPLGQDCAAHAYTPSAGSSAIF